MAALLRLIAILVLLCAGFALPGADAAAAEVTPRAAVHKGFGRMVFDWDVPVVYSTEIVGDSLVLRFNQMPAGDLRRVLRPLSGYLRGLEVADEGRRLTFALARPVQVRAFMAGSSLVVDLLDRPGAPPPPAAEAAAVPELGVRSGEHTGFYRLVFDWPRPVGYRVNQRNARAVITFDRPARIDAAALRAAVPADMSVLEVGHDARSTTVVLVLPPEARLRHFRSGPKVVVDLVRPAGGTPPLAADGSAKAPVPLAPPPGAAEQPPSIAPPPATPAKEAAVPEPPPPPRDAAAAAPQAAEPAAAAAMPEEVKAPRLVFSWPQPVAAAAFRRAGWLWLVFDRPQVVRLDDLRQAAGPVLRHVEQLPNPDATVLRLATLPGWNPSLRRDGLTWTVELAEQPLRPATPIEVKMQAEGEAKLFLPVAEGGTVFRLVDPEVGDTMMVVPVVPLGHGVHPAGDYPELELPATAQGVVVVPRADDVQLRSDRTGVEISAPGGLKISQARPGKLAALRLGEAPAAASPLFDIRGWSRLASGDAAQAEDRMKQRIAELPANLRNPARLDLARLYAANGRAAEALSVLRVMAADEPDREEEAAYRAVRGAAQLIMGRYDLAAEDLAHPDLEKVNEAVVWRALALSRIGDPAQQAPVAIGGVAYLKDYPPRIRKPLAFMVADTLLAGGEGGIADEVLKLLAAEKLTRAEKAALAYLQGVRKALDGAFDEAIASWRQAEESDNRQYRAKAAMARIELELKTERIGVKEAMEGLERLRFAWRDDAFEYNLLRRLGEMQIDAGDYGGGLRTLKQLATYYSQHKGVEEVAKLMNDTFARLFLEGAADQMPPVTAIALFDEFRELTPPGEKGDEMIRRLADRLVQVDLLDRAADLLGHQVEFRLQGVEKARVGAQLALVELLNRRPGKAIEALKKSEAADMPPGLRQQRHHLQASALDELGRSEEAVALLQGDDSFNARLLLAEIHWRHQDWREAARAFEALVGPPGPGGLDNDSARFVLHWATALTLANDERGVMRLRERYGALMERTPYRDAFRLMVTSPLEGLSDYRSVTARIEEAEGFQAFMAAYRQRLQAEGLSAIN